MKKLLNAFYMSFVIFGVISIILFVAQVLSIGYENISLKKSYLPTIFIFYIPILIAFLYHRKENFKNVIFKSIFTSFIVSYISLYFFFKYILGTNYNSFFNSNLLSLAFISFFTTLFFSICLIVYDKNRLKNVIKIKVKYSHKELLIIPFLCAILFTVISLITNPNIFNISVIWINVFPLGVICSYISFNFFNFIYIKTDNIKRSFFIILYYILVALIFALAFNLIKVLSLNLIFKFKISINHLVHVITLFEPYFLLTIASVHLVYLKLVTKEQKNQLTQQSLESQLNYQQLKNQISPHFLFNNINVLTSLIEENPKKAVAYSENLSHIYRYFLEQEKQDVVLVKDEVEFAKSYLELLKDRFEIGFNFTITIEEKAKEKYIVSTILQQVLENVVKHNTINETNVVELKITNEENYLIVENNKNLKIKTVSDSKKGIENIKKRIAFFTDEKVIIEDAETHFIIKLPILETV
mgnify:CR=1 FL=1